MIATIPNSASLINLVIFFINRGTPKGKMRAIPKYYGENLLKTISFYPEGW